MIRVQAFDAAVFGVCVSEDTLQRFFTHSLTRVLTHQPVFKGEKILLCESQKRNSRVSVSTTLFSVCVIVMVCVPVICVVSDAIAGQSEWTFAKTLPLLTALFRKVNELVIHTQSDLSSLIKCHSLNQLHCSSFYT